MLPITLLHIVYAVYTRAFSVALPRSEALHRALKKRQDCWGVIARFYFRHFLNRTGLNRTRVHRTETRIANYFGDKIAQSCISDI